MEKDQSKDPDKYQDKPMKKTSTQSSATTKRRVQLVKGQVGRKLRMTLITSNNRVPYDLFQEEDYFICENKELNIVGSGVAKELAISSFFESLEDAVKLYAFEDDEVLDTLAQQLKRKLISLISDGKICLPTKESQ